MRIFALLFMLLIGAYAQSQTVASCSSAASGTVWPIATFLPCTPAAVYVAQPLPAATIINDMRCTPGVTACAFKWTNQAGVLPTDQVWVIPAGATAGQWTAASNVKWATSTPPPPGTSTATLSWTPPIANTDGTPLTNLASYNVYQGPSATALTKVASVAAPASSYAVTGLAPGTYTFGVTAVNSAGVESAQGNNPSATISPPATVPGSPSSVSVTVTVTVP